MKVETNKFVKKHRIVIAHRGASGYLPEHTLAASCLAYGLGADFLEPDVVLTKDSIPIVLHDLQLDETTDVEKKFPGRNRSDGRFYALDFTLAEIKQLKVHERIDLSTGKRVFPKRFPSHYSQFQVPTLEELLQLLVGLNKTTRKDVGLYPEIKEPVFHLNEGKDIAKIVHELIARYEKELGDAPLFWQCFHADTLKRFQTEFASPYPRILLIDDGDLELRDSKKLEQQIVKIASFSHGIGPSFAHVFDSQGHSSGLVKLAHKYKLLVHAYTVRFDLLPGYVDSLDGFLKKIFHDEKLDGVFTDFTDKVVHFLSKA